MSKSEKRRRKPAKNRGHQQASSRNQTGPRTQSSVPSAQTMWRTMHLDWRVYDKLVETTMNLHPSLWKRDADKIQMIEQAADIEAVLDLATDAIGLARYAWPKRIREFGPMLPTTLLRDSTAIGCAAMRGIAPPSKNTISGHFGGVRTVRPMPWRIAGTPWMTMDEVSRVSSWDWWARGSLPIDSGRSTGTPDLCRRPCWSAPSGA